jgi:hypothetical protein
MRQEGDDIDSGACTFIKGELNPCHNCWQVVWPPDALTRLLMEADGVTDSALHALLKRVVLKRQNYTLWALSSRQNCPQSSGGSVVDGPAVRYAERITDGWTSESPV